MIPNQFTELTIKASPDEARNISIILKYIIFVAVAICTVVVCTLFVKVSLIPADPHRSSLQNRITPIKEKKIVPDHEVKEPVYIVGVNIEFETEPTITIHPKLEAKYIVQSNNNNKENPLNNIKNQIQKPHVFHSISTPTKKILEQTTSKPLDFDIITKLPKPQVRKENTQVKTNPFEPNENEKSDLINDLINELKKIFSSVFQVDVDETPQKHNEMINPEINTEVKPLFNSKYFQFEPINPFERNENFFFFPSSDPIENEEEIINPIFQTNDDFYYFPNSDPFIDLNEEIIDPFDSFKTENIFFQFPSFHSKPFLNFEEEKLESSSEEFSKETLDNQNDSFGNLYRETFSNFFENLF